MQKQPNNKLFFSKVNYVLIIIGVILIAAGYICMLLDKEPHGFGILGITLGPIILMMGFMIQFLAIMYVKKEK